MSFAIDHERVRFKGSMLRFRSLIEVTYEVDDVINPSSSKRSVASFSDFYTLYPTEYAAAGIACSVDFVTHRRNHPIERAANPSCGDS
jgi:hypothetical protein